MVNAIQKEGKKYFQCGDCGFLYKEKEFARKCEDWCLKYKSCNMEITAHAIGKEVFKKYE